MNQSDAVPLSVPERLAAVVSAAVLATTALLLTVQIRKSPTYPDFIVGTLAWSSGSKLQDLIAAPIFISILTISVLSILGLIRNIRMQYGHDAASSLANHLLFWSIPAIAIFVGKIFNYPITKEWLLISMLGVIAHTWVASRNKKRDVFISATHCSLILVTLILLLAIPFEVTLLTSRIAPEWSMSTDLTKPMIIGFSIAVTALLAGMLTMVFGRRNFGRAPAKLILLAQMGVPLFYLALIPAKLKLPDGSITQFQYGQLLPVLLSLMVLWGMIDAVRRYMKYSSQANWSSLFSPIALFPLLIVLKVGGTTAPRIYPDDYHVGELLLGAWSYIHGAVPYVNYIPAHGIMEDDIGMLLSHLLYDGTAGTLTESGRLAWSALALIACLSIYRFAGSLFLAMLCTYLLSGRNMWLFLAPFICLWLSPSLRANPSKWLGAWIACIPIIVLGIPAQGMVLVATSGVLAASAIWALLKDRQRIQWKFILTPLVAILVLSAVTPLGDMLFSSINYVLKNASINETAYGTPWERSWTSQSNSILLQELSRNLWLLLPIFAITLIWQRRQDLTLKSSTALPALMLLMFFLLMIPYSMGRIDPGYSSRQGLVSIFACSFLVPVLGWLWLRPVYRGSILFTSVAACATLGMSPLVSDGFLHASHPFIDSAPLKDGQKAGMDNIGQAAADEEHWERLNRLKGVLDRHLSPGDPYLDLTSRNAQYLYMNRLPVVAVTAPYNLAPPAQQKSEIEALERNLPKIALLEGNNIIHDGGGIALRTPYLFRFIFDNYTAVLEDGFVIGIRKSEKAPVATNSFKFSVKHLTDANWEKGVHRTEAAVIAESPVLLDLLKVGDQVHFTNGESRTVTKLWRDGSAIFFDGAPLDAERFGAPQLMEISVDTQSMEKLSHLLFNSAVHVDDLRRIPASWGKSEASLSKRMTLVNAMDEMPQTLHDLVKTETSYKVSGDAPYLQVDMTSANLAGTDAGLLRFKYTCSGGTGRPQLRVSWWGDESSAPLGAESLQFSGQKGVLIVPLDISPLWLSLKKVAGLRIALTNPEACQSMNITELRLLERAL